MSRRKSEITGHMHERGFPHHIELEPPPWSAPRSYASTRRWISGRFAGMS
jgi:hypothetical protein